MKNEVIEIYLDDIIPNRFQPREKFDEEALNELSTSIKEHGVIQPIIVRQLGDKYEIIAGERRYKASALAGLTKIPAIIRNLDDKEASKVALLENLQRKDLTAIEEARTYQKILELDSMTQEELGKTMGKSQAAIANKLRLLSLTDEVQEALLNDQISERHARSLLNLTNGNEQIEMLNRVIRERMTVRELDIEIKKLNASKQVKLELNDEPIIIEEPKEPVLTPLNNPDIETLEDEPNLSSTKDIKESAKENISSTNIVSKEKVDNNLQTESSENNYIETKQNINNSENKNTNLFIPNLDNLENNETSLNQENKEFIEDFKYQDAINLVKNLIPEINSKGINANMQEFDLDNKYQIVINIDKK